MDKLVRWLRDMHQGAHGVIALPIQLNYRRKVAGLPSSATRTRRLLKQGFVDVSNKVHRGFVPAENQQPVAAGTSSLEAKAARLHMLGRLRGKHFFTPVMADSAMDIMLSLLVGDLQSNPVSESLLAVGNMLNREEARSMVDRLVQAGLVTVSGDDPEQRTVGLTPLGSARMRSFVSDYPDV